VPLAKLLPALMLAGCIASGTIGGAYYSPDSIRSKGRGA